ncbi:MAG: cell surface protein SprA, partial [Paludibacteraceae bacterium]|nr:cell surface protein SprA [Paludibacteraceae bacterium]
MRKLINILLLLLLPMVVVGQSRQPLIPSARNDRKMAEEREKARLDSIKAVTGDGLQVTDGTELTAAQDSAIMNPLGADRIGDVKTEVVYDPVTGGYIIHTKIGDTDIATPYLLNEQEYKDYSERELMHRYWQQKIGEVEHNNERKFDITDMKFNIGPADKVFGPGGVQLKLQGSAELLFGFKHQYIDNPSLTQKARNNNIFDFDEKIQVNVNGKVGTRLNFNLNYNTEASFSFDQQNLKLTYKGEEDDIIQSIEAGNVSMDLNSSLIRGTQALFGFKTTLKFGKLKIQGLISQQNSESQTVNSQGGAQLTKFEIGAEKYDENRHFFLGYFFRDKYEQAMSALPYVASGVTINKIEVWVTNKRGTYDQARNIVAFVDLGEVQKHIYNPKWVPNGQVPNNLSNSLYVNVIELPGIRDIQQVSAILQGENLESGDEFEK